MTSERSGSLRTVLGQHVATVGSDGRQAWALSWPRLPPATWIIWHITQRCNLACEYCFTDSSPASPAPLAAGALRHTVRAINESRAALVTIIGGEPFTVRGLPEDVEALLSSSDRKVNIDTNGLFLRNRWSQWSSATTGTRRPVSGTSPRYPPDGGTAGRRGARLRRCHPAWSRRGWWLQQRRLIPHHSGCRPTHRRPRSAPPQCLTTRCDSAGQPGVHGEPLTAPVHTVTEPAHLVEDQAAGLGLHCQTRSMNRS